MGLTSSVPHADTGRASRFRKFGVKSVWRVDGDTNSEDVGAGGTGIFCGRNHEFRAGGATKRGRDFRVARGGAEGGADPGGGVGNARAAIPRKRGTGFAPLRENAGSFITSGIMCARGRPRRFYDTAVTLFVHPRWGPAIDPSRDRAPSPRRSLCPPNNASRRNP